MGRCMEPGAEGIDISSIAGVVETKRLVKRVLLCRAYVPAARNDIVVSLPLDVVRQVEQRFDSGLHLQLKIG